MTELNKKNCLVIGRNSSLGTEISKYFSSMDYRVIGSSVSATSQDSSTQLLLDLTRPHTFDSFASNISNIDCLIFAAGLLPGKALNKFSYEEIREVFEVNSVGIVTLFKYLEEKLNDSGSVIFLNSIAAFNGSFDPIYASSKSSLSGFIKSMAKNTKRKIRYNELALGLVRNTNMFQEFEKKDLERHLNEIPMAEYGDPTEIAKICFDICQPHWSYLNGQTIHLNGGRYV